MQALGYFQKWTSIGIIMLMNNCMTFNKCLHLLWYFGMHTYVMNCNVSKVHTEVNKFKLYLLGLQYFLYDLGWNMQSGKL